ncbi:MAG: PQQ-binding-like beta-propeller repeat protein [Acetobacteraceae bacterium]
MTGKSDETVAGLLSRRAALLAPLALGGCGWWDDLFGSKKVILPGRREPVSAMQNPLTVSEGVPKVTLPPAVRNAAWPQAGGNPAHFMGHLAASDRLAQSWRSDIGDGGGYRRKILAQPVVAEGTVFTMDSDATVSAFDLANGGRRWRFDTKDEDADSTNVGGGLGYDQGVLYAVNGLGDLVAIDPAAGTERWRSNLGAPGRSAPTIAEGRIYVITIEDRLLCLATTDGRQIWAHRAATPTLTVLGRPAPAFSRGLVVGGFGSGELSTMNAETGRVLWTDGLGASRGRSSIADLLSIHGLPVISNGRVYAVSMGGLLAAIDLPTGRRLWERPITGISAPLVAGDWVFVVSIDQEMFAVNATDGRIAWITPLPRWDNPDKRRDPLTWFGPLLVSDRLVVTGTSEQALAISPYTGEILGRQPLAGDASPVPPLVAEGTVLVVSDDGSLTAFR